MSVTQENLCIWRSGSGSPPHSEAGKRSTACPVEIWELRCIVPGRENFIYGCIRNKQEEVWWRYRGTVLNSVRPFPGHGHCRKPGEELDAANESYSGSNTQGWHRQQNNTKTIEKWMDAVSICHILMQLSIMKIVLDVNCKNVWTATPL